MSDEKEPEVGCSKCGKPMPAERLELGLSKCKDCSPKGKPKGIMVYGHKTGGVLETVDEQVFKEMKGSSDDKVESL